jgi:hypothetical protein
MHFSVVDKIFWGAVFFLNLALLFVLLFRRRWRTFPILTAWMAFLLLRSVLLFLIYQSSPMHLSSYLTWLWYTRVYVVGGWIDFILQLGLVFEIARIVLRPTGTWARDARAQFAAAGFGGIALAALVAWLVSPPAWSARYAWQIRGDLFTSLVICELFVAMALTANRLGLGWRNHVIAVGQGLTAWTSLMVVTTALQSFLGTKRYYLGLDHARGLAYIAAVTWMTLQLWRDEPERKPISADLQEYILALHRRVEYDLRRLDARH